MALIKPEQLRDYPYNISGSFSGSFQGDGSGLSNILPSLSLGNIFIGNTSSIATDVSMSGDVHIDSLGVTTIQSSSVTYDKIQNVTQKALLGSVNISGSTVTEIPIIDAYLINGSITGYLDTPSNWDINGNYIGPSITGTYQGQNHYNANYWFTSVDNDVWIRLIRG
tara:strand:+ start:6672 stop:7172 length:501 start_codon:yes stop_codon:yes gene_type:complete